MLLLFAGGYLLGAVPFCYIIGRLYGVDIRRVGSGNVGGTNLRRALKGKPVGVPMSIVGLVLDGVKGFMAAWALPGLALRYLVAATGHPTPGSYVAYVEWMEIAAGVAAVLGHTYTIFLRFRGGKGVATGLGMFLAICWQAALTGLAVFLVVYLFSRIASLGSLIGAATVPIAAGLFYHFTDGMQAHEPVLAMLVAVVVLVFVRHRSNIQRLIRGEELSFREQAQGNGAAPTGASSAAAGGPSGAGGDPPVETAGEPVERHAH
ncbi:MAG: glycerol-3-phosphate 1-O-acyltransferase PlsY [Planctomycetota bacterium]